MNSTDTILDALQGLERTLDGRLGDHRDEMKGLLESIERKLRELEVTSRLGIVALTRVEERVDAPSPDLGRLRFDVNQLRAKVSGLEDRLERVESVLIDE